MGAVHELLRTTHNTMLEPDRKRQQLDYSSSCFATSEGR